MDTDKTLINKKIISSRIRLGQYRAQRFNIITRQYFTIVLQSTPLNYLSHCNDRFMLQYRGRCYVCVTTGFQKTLDVYPNVKGTRAAKRVSSNVSCRVLDERSLINALEH